MIKTKKCSKCGNFLELIEENFRKVKHRNGKRYFRAECRECEKKYATGYRKKNPYNSWSEEQKERHKKYNKEKYKNNPKKYEEIRRKWYIKKKYGITLEEEKELLIKCNYKCKICGIDLKHKKFCIDHNHKTNKIRGILCDDCNRGLGSFRDNLFILVKSIEYLKKDF